ncbi:hypothetical protein ACQ5SK_18645 [Bradyrhizobium japonicum]
MRDQPTLQGLCWQLDRFDVDLRHGVRDDALDVLRRLTERAVSVCNFLQTIRDDGFRQPSIGDCGAEGCSGRFEGRKLPIGWRRSYVSFAVADDTSRMLAILASVDPSKATSGSRFAVSTWARLASSNGVSGDRD